jgi:hypothetical protein
MLGKLRSDHLGWISPTLAVITAAISLYSVVMQNQKFAVDASDLHARWNRLANDYQRLWGDMYAEDAIARLDALITKEEELSKAGTAFPNHSRLMNKWEDHVVMHHEHELSVS